MSSRRPRSSRVSRNVTWPVGKAATKKYKPPVFPLVRVVPDRCGVAGAAQGELVLERIW
jgi:hypothetical protein